jgi:hypothetical protein
MKKAIFKLVQKAQTFIDANGNYITALPALYILNNRKDVKKIEGNRDIAKPNINKLGRSVTQLGAVLRALVLIKMNGEYYLADGQHLAAYLDSVDLPSYAIIHECKDMTEAMRVVTTMNSSSRNWGIKQFVNGWCHINAEYVELENFRKSSGLTYTTVAALLTANTIGNAKKAIINGTFVITDKEEAIRRIRAVDLFYNATGMERSQYCTTGLIEYFAILSNATDGTMRKFYKIQKQFHACVRKGMEDKNMHGKTFGRTDDYVAFFKDCYDK